VFYLKKVFWLISCLLVGGGVVTIIHYLSAQNAVFEKIWLKHKAREFVRKFISYFCICQWKWLGFQNCQGKTHTFYRNIREFLKSNVVRTPLKTNLKKNVVKNIVTFSKFQFLANFASRLTLSRQYEMYKFDRNHHQETLFRIFYIY
jgi:hypothetical protein